MSNGSVIGLTKVVDNGPDSSLYNLVILAEGYTASQLPNFHSDVSNFVATLQATPPYGANWQAINIYRIDVASTDSGAADPIACGGTGAAPATYFNASFCNGGIQRLLEVNDTTVHTVVNNYLPTAHAILVLVNSGIYGGSETLGPGGIGVFSTNRNSALIGLHELGHTFGLADEYPTWAGCGSGESGHNTYTGGEPTQPNVTANTDRTTLKWREFVDSSTPVPTTANPNCDDCDPRTTSPVPAGTVGAFEGAYYYHCGAYRPEFTCMMLALGVPYCTVCETVIAANLSIYTCTISGISKGTPMAGKLDTMRSFRDDWLAASPAGRRLIDLLAQHDAEVSTRLAVDGPLRERTQALLERAYAIVESRDSGEPLIFDGELIMAAADVLGEFAANGSVALRRAADSSRADLHGLQGKSAAEAF